MTDNKKSGRARATYSQTIRLMRILELFHLRRRKGLTITEIMDHFDVTKRTVNRDLAALQELYIPLVENIDNPETRIKVWRLHHDYHFGGRP